MSAAAHNARKIYLRSILFMVISTACFSTMTSLIRFISDDLHSTEIVFFRNVFSALLFLPWVLKHKGSVLKTNRMWDHFWRATIGIIGMQSWFYCVSHMPLNEATALSFTAPIFTTLFAILFLGEKAGIHRWSAVICGFVGAMVIIRPDPENMNLIGLIVLFATSMWSIAGMLVKSLTKSEHPLLIVFYMAAFMTLWSFPVMLPHWQMPSVENLIFALLLAIASTGAHFFMVKAYASSDVSMLMPFDFCRLIFTSILAYVFFGEVSDMMTWVGGAIIVTSAAYIAHREAVLQRPKQSEPQAGV